MKMEWKQHSEFLDRSVLSSGCLGQDIIDKVACKQQKFISSCLRGWEVQGDELDQVQDQGAGRFRVWREPTSWFIDSHPLTVISKDVQQRRVLRGGTFIFLKKIPCHHLIFMELHTHCGKHYITLCPLLSNVREDTGDGGMLNRLGASWGQSLGRQFRQVLGNRCHPDSSTLGSMASNHRLPASDCPAWQPSNQSCSLEIV